MANKKRTQNKRAGKKQRRRTAAKYRGGMRSAARERREKERNSGLHTASRSTIRTIEPDNTIKVYMILPLETGLGISLFHQGAYNFQEHSPEHFQELINYYKTQIERQNNYMASYVLYKINNNNVELIFANAEMYNRYEQEGYKIKHEIWMTI